MYSVAFLMVYSIPLSSLSIGLEALNLVTDIPNIVECAGCAGFMAMMGMRWVWMKTQQHNAPWWVNINP